MILTIGTRKGGAGKSTITTNLAAMRTLRKHEVCLVDTDDQQNAAMWGAVRGEKREEGEYQPPYVPTVCVTGSGTLAAITAQASKYSDLIIDVPGRDASELRAAFMASDVIALPLKPSQFDLWAFRKDLALIEETRIVKETMKVPFRAVIFFNGIHTNPASRIKQLESLSGYLGTLEEEIKANKIEICPHYISQRSIFDKAVDGGLSVHELNGGGASDAHARSEMDMLYTFIYGSKK